MRWKDFRVSKRSRADGEWCRDTRQERQYEKRERAREKVIKLRRNLFFKQIQIEV